MTKGWRVSEGKCRKSGATTVYLRENDEVRFECTRSAMDVTDEWYKKTRLDAKVICDRMNGVIAAPLLLSKLHRAKEVLGAHHADLSPLEQQFWKELEELLI